MATEDENYDSNVRVALRARPLSVQEKCMKNASCVNVISDSEVVIGNGKIHKRFTFDFAFDSLSTQGDIYNSTCSELIDGVLYGYNSTVSEHFGRFYNLKMMRRFLSTLL